MAAETNSIHAKVYSDSIFKYLHSGDGVSVDLSAIRGGRITDLTNVVEKTSPADIVVMHVGTNDISSPATTTEGLRRDWDRMLLMLDYTYSCPVIISGMLPRLDRIDLEPLRVAGNQLLSSLASRRGPKFTFLSWDDHCFSESSSFFSIDGLHPSREGNAIIHRHLKYYIRWVLSGEKEVSNKIIGKMINSELLRTRREAARMRSIRLAKKNIKTTSIFRGRSWSSRTHAIAGRRCPPRPVWPRKREKRCVPQTTPLLDVAGCVVVRPKISGWGLTRRTSTPEAAKSQEKKKVKEVKKKYVKGGRQGLSKQKKERKGVSEERKKGVREERKGKGVSEKRKGKGVSEERKEKGASEERKGKGVSEERKGKGVSEERKGKGVSEERKGKGVSEERKGKGASEERKGKGASEERKGKGVSEERKGKGVSEERKGKGASEKGKGVSEERKGKGVSEERKEKGASEKGKGVSEERKGKGVSEERTEKGASEERKGKGVSEERKGKGVSEERKGKGVSDERKGKGVSEERKEKGASEERKEKGASEERKGKGASEERKGKGVSEERKEKGASEERKGVSEERKGKGVSEERKEKGASEERKGKGVSEERKGKGVSEERMEKGASEERKGKGVSEERKGKGVSEERKGKGVSEERKGKGVSEERKGKGVSEERKGKGASEERKGKGASEERKGKGVSEERKGKGVSEERKGEGVSEERKEKGASEERKGKGVSEERKGEGVSEERKEKGASEERKGKGASEERKGKGVSEERKEKGASEERKGKGGSEERKGKGVSEERKGKGASEERKGKGASEERKGVSEERKDKGVSQERKGARERQAGGGEEHLVKTQKQTEGLPDTETPACTSHPVKTFSSINEAGKTSSVLHASTLPPLSQLYEIKHTLSLLEKQHGQLYQVEFVSGIQYSLKDIELAINVKQAQASGRSMHAEQKWLTQPFSGIDAETSLSQAVINEFANLILNNPPDATVEISSSNVNIEDLVSLTQKNWLTNFLFLHFMNKLTRQCSGIKPFYLGSLSEIQSGVRRAIKKEDTNQIIFYFLVNFKGPFTKINPSGNHFVFAVYFIHDNELVYADPLGGDIPEGFTEHLKLGLSNSEINPDHLKITRCHDPTSRNHDSHECSLLCSSIYPLQTCGDVCGVAAIIGITISALRPDLFKIMTAKNPTMDNSLKQIDYLKHISKYSAFLRHVIIHWILSENIDVSLLLVKQVHDASTHIDKSPDNTLGNSRKKSLIKHDNAHSIASDEQNMAHDRQHTHVHTSANQLQRPEKRKNRTYTLQHNTSLLQYLKREPYITYKTMERRLVLTISPKGSKSQVYKKVACTTLGLDDNEAMEKVNTFLQSSECLEKVKKLASESENSSSKPWQEIDKIKVGQAMKSYFDKFTFDTLKHFRVHESVIPSYHDNQFMVSVTSNPYWGKTHRLDETYSYKKEKLDKNIPVVNLTIQCAGKTTECRAQCGNLISSIDRSRHITNCSGCGQDIGAQNTNICAKCERTDSCHWHKYSENVEGSGQVLCNPCYRQMLKYKEVKTITVNKSSNNVIRHSHFECKWKLSCVVYSHNLDQWVIYAHENNHLIHKDKPFQQIKRPSLSDRDEIDHLRTTSKMSADQIKGSFQRKKSLYVVEHSELKELREKTTKHQIQNRVAVVDRHLLTDYLNKKDNVPLVGSDWRNAEKIVEEHIDSVLFFQRGFQKINRNYHFVLANDRNLLMAQYGQHIMGYDNNYDSTSVRFPIGILTICDKNNIGKVVAVSMSNSEEAKVHALTIQIVLLNVPCKDKNCDHEQKTYVFNDGNGIFKFRPCSLKSPYCPMIQHDKDPSIKLAVSQLGLSSSLCNFHALQALKRHIHEDISLNLFITPLVTGFKTIMRCWSAESQTSMTEKYIQFIMYSIPDHLLPSESKVKFTNYLNKNWFHSNWSSAFTAEVLYQHPVSERRNPLILTDNVTERKFRAIAETIFNCKLNKSVANFVLLMIDKFLYSEGLTNDVPEKSSRKANVRSLTREKICCEKGLQIVKDGRLILPTDWDQHGWFGVQHESSATSLQLHELPDKHFSKLGVDPLKSAYEDIDLNYHHSSQTSGTSQVTRQITTEHCYDVQSKCKKLLSKLEFKLASDWHDELLKNVPGPCHSQLESHTCQYVCNLNIGICSCYSFICKGQPYMCKHLYAGLSMKQNIFESSSLVDTYRTHSPTYQPEPKPPTEFSNGHVAPESQTCQVLQDTLQKYVQMSYSFTKSCNGKSDSIHLLKVLHDKPLQLHLMPGRLANRQPHNCGNRRKGGPMKDSNYSLVMHPDPSCSPQFDSDPYRPQVPFPEKAKESHRHGGRKRIRVTKRVSFQNIISSALDSLNHKMKSKLSSQSEEVDTQMSDPGDTEVDITSAQDPPSTMKSINNSKVATCNLNTNSSRKRKAASHDTSTKGPMLCNFCITTNQLTPFTCHTLQEFNLHLVNVHCPNSLLCGICFEHSGVLLPFSSLAQFKIHQKNMHCSFVNISNEPQHSINTSIFSQETSECIQTKNTKPSVTTQNKLSLSKRRKKCPSVKSADTNKTFTCTDPNKIDYYCPTCLKPCEEIPPSICCDTCNFWYHFTCVGIQKAPKQNDNWHCAPCMHSKLKTEP